MFRPASGPPYSALPVRVFPVFSKIRHIPRHACSHRAPRPVIPPASVAECLVRPWPWGAVGGGGGGIGGVVRPLVRGRSHWVGFRGFVAAVRRSITRGYPRASRRRGTFRMPTRRRERRAWRPGQRQDSPTRAGAHAGRFDSEILRHAGARMGLVRQRDSLDTRRPTVPPKRPALGTPGSVRARTCPRRPRHESVRWRSRLAPPRRPDAPASQRHFAASPAPHAAPAFSGWNPRPSPPQGSSTIP